MTESDQPFENYIFEKMPAWVLKITFIIQCSHLILKNVVVLFAGLVVKEHMSLSYSWNMQVSSVIFGYMVNRRHAQRC